MRHGGDVERIARSRGVDPDSLLDLSASLNPLAPSVAALAASHLGSLRRYPDPAHAHCVLARAIGVEPERLLLTNGGAEAIALLGQTIGGRVDEPEFSLHPRHGLSPATALGWSTSTPPLWCSNPNNPTGRLAGPGQRADVWDEAFYPLATGEWTRGDPQAIAVVGSLTKLFECPGLRLGYAIADPGLIARLAARQPEWSVGSLALALLPELLEQADLPAWARAIAALRGDLTDLLRRYGLTPEPSAANFILCPAPLDFRERLIDHGVIVRDCTSFGLPDHVRIAVPDAAGLERLAAALVLL
jgi:histidinol-phosphate/aromatic aminotransferase/cobyric acid decarboxylase-like protein